MGEPQDPLRGWDRAVLGAALATSVVAAAYWSRSYESIRGSGIFAVAWVFLVPAVVALALIAMGVASYPVTLVVLAAPVPVAVVGRVLIDSSDPGAHDLWPLEVVVAGLASGALVAAAASGGWVLFVLSGRKSR